MHFYCTCVYLLFFFFLSFFFTEQDNMTQPLHLKRVRVHFFSISIGIYLVEYSIKLVRTRVWLLITKSHYTLLVFLTCGHGGSLNCFIINLLDNSLIFYCPRESHGLSLKENPPCGHFMSSSGLPTRHGHFLMFQELICVSLIWFRFHLKENNALKVFLKLVEGHKTCKRWNFFFMPGCYQLQRLIIFSCVGNTLNETCFKVGTQANCERQSSSNRWTLIISRIGI